MNILGILGGDPEVRNGFNDIRVHFDIDADADAGGHRGARGAVAEALGGVRRRHEPVERQRHASTDRAGTLTHIPVVVIGAGHAGLAVSRVLSDRGVEHVVLERGEVANTWRTERWDSLRLLTPNWQTRLPGLAYDGDDPDGFMTVAGARRASSSATPSHVDAPVRTRTEVTSRRRRRLGLRRVDHRRDLGGAGRRAGDGRLQPAPSSPPSRPSLPAELEQVTTLDYKRPDRLRPGRVLVVGASATGIQIADELLRSGREVTVAVGEHVRMPRTYRARRHHVVARPHRAPRRALRRGRRPRPRPPRPLAAARRHAGPRRPRPQRARRRAAPSSSGGSRRCATARRYFSGSLRNVCTLADLKLIRLLDTIDAWAAAGGLGDAGGRRVPSRRASPTRRGSRRPRRRRLRDRALGHRLPRRLLVARRCRCSTARASCATTAASSATRRGCTGSGSTSCGAASPASSTAPRTTRPTSSRTSSGTSAHNQDIPYQLCVVC